MSACRAAYPSKQMQQFVQASLKQLDIWLLQGEEVLMYQNTNVMSIKSNNILCGLFDFM
jgi:hypothetical protein